MQTELPSGRPSMHLLMDSNLWMKLLSESTWFILCHIKWIVLNVIKQKRRIAIKVVLEQIIQYFSPKINLQTFDGFSVTTNYQRILALKEFLVMKTFQADHDYFIANHPNGKWEARCISTVVTIDPRYIVNIITTLYTLPKYWWEAMTIKLNTLLKYLRVTFIIKMKDIYFGYLNLVLCLLYTSLLGSSNQLFHSIWYLYRIEYILSSLFKAISW